MAVETVAPPKPEEPVRILFLGSMYAGHATRFMNLEAHSRYDPRIRPTYRRVTGWVEGGLIESLPLLPAAAKGRARAVLEASAFARVPRPDVIWSSARESLAPFWWSQVAMLRRPLLLDLDWTLEQQEAWAPYYFGRAPKRGLRLALARAQERLVWRSVTLFTPWSQWAAASIRETGVGDDRIRVIPPGVDLEAWQPPSGGRPAAERPLRLLFVGGDFVRKGGDMLLELMRSRFAGPCELDIVTREPVEAQPGVRVHRAEANSPELKALYAGADLFVLPSRAECFGIATVEAMASGLPAIVSDVGGARDIVDEGETGWLIRPTPEDLALALESALARRDELPAMGARARAVAEERFDGAANDRAVVDAALEARERFQERRARGEGR